MKDGIDQQLRQAGADHGRLLHEFVEREGAALRLLAGWALETLESGGKLLLFGNGGSASHAQHLAAEFTNRFRRKRKGLAAIALTTDGAVLTSIANDTSFDLVFSRQIEALGRPGDLAIAISTSGNSANVIEGLREARRMEIRSAALLGGGNVGSIGSGGIAATEADLALRVDGNDTPRIQEVQLVAGHVLCDWVEARVIGRASQSASASARRPTRSVRT